MGGCGVAGGGGGAFVFTKKHGFCIDKFIGGGKCDNLGGSQHPAWAGGGGGGGGGCSDNACIMED